jgi:hypothetical protein
MKTLSHAKSADNLATEVTKFQEDLKNWTNLETLYLVYALDHEYTGAALRLDTLKGSDRARGRFIAEACATVPEVASSWPTLRGLSQFRMTKVLRSRKISDLPG